MRQERALDTKSNQARGVRPWEYIALGSLTTAAAWLALPHAKVGAEKAWDIAADALTKPTECSEKTHKSPVMPFEGVQSAINGPDGVDRSGPTDITTIVKRVEELNGLSGDYRVTAGQMLLVPDGCHTE